MTFHGHWVASRKRKEKTVSFWDLSAQDILPGRKDLYDPEYSDIAGSGMQISPDGKMLVTASNNRLSIRDIRGSDLPILLSVKLPSVVTIRGISADSRWLITEDGLEVCVWPLDFEYLKKEALRVVGRTLTPRERRVYDIPQLSQHSP